MTVVAEAYTILLFASFKSLGVPEHMEKRCVHYSVFEQSETCFENTDMQPYQIVAVVHNGAKFYHRFQGPWDMCFGEKKLLLSSRVVLAGKAARQGIQKSLRPQNLKSEVVMTGLQRIKWRNVLITRA